MMHSLFPRLQDDKEPTITSWLNALHNSRGRTQAALKGLNPWDAVVDYMREKHHLLIGEATAENMQLELGGADPEQPRTMTIQGRNLLTGLPARLEVTSTEIQPIGNSQAAQPYVDWSAKADDETIGDLLYAIAVHEVNWFFIGVLRQAPPPDVEALIQRDPENIAAFVRGQTMAQHYQRLQIIRNYLYKAYREMTLEDFQLTRMGREFTCSPEGVAHELCQFEAERLSEITHLLAAARKALDAKAEHE